MPERVRFFSGQFLTAEDFATEQKYHIEMRRLHNRTLHGAGIVEGLGVSAGGTDANPVVVSPGFAVDGLGREIIVDDSVRVAVGACEKEICFVTLQYTETATDPAPTANGGSEFSRVMEGFSIGTATEDPTEDENAPLLGLARLIRQNGGWQVDGSYCPMSLCRST